MSRRSVSLHQRVILQVTVSLIGAIPNRMMWDVNGYLMRSRNLILTFNLDLGELRLDVLAKPGSSQKSRQSSPFGRVVNLILTAALVQIFPSST